MKLCRYDNDRLGLVEGDAVIDVSAALEALTAVRWPYPPGDAVIANWDRLRPRVVEVARSGARKPLAQVKLRAPIGNTTKIIGIARNRKNLATEKIDPGVQAGGTMRKDGDPIEMFIKAPSALAGPADGVSLRFTNERNDPEAELTVVIGKTGTDIPRARALDHVFGYCIGLDMTLRGAGSMSARKSLDSYALIGPWIVTADEIADPDNIETKLIVNGRIVQQANTRDLAFDIRSLIANASNFYTLHPGDAIMVGTPAQFTQVHPGDHMIAEFAGIGRMDVAVRAHG